MALLEFYARIFSGLKSGDAGGWMQLIGNMLVLGYKKTFLTEVRRC